MPAVMVELAFITNPEEERILLSEEFQKKAAEAIADGVLRYLGQ
jgi:N-acetylmuramoyl-L-alanine amidase